MQPRSFAALAAATAISLGLAGWAVAGRDRPLTAMPEPQPMFMGLLDQLNGVQAIRVTGAEGKLTLRRTPAGGWVVEERGGYPADPEQVRELGLGLASLQLVERKTASRDRLARLELDDPQQAGAKAKQIELVGEGDKPIAGAVVGKSRFGLYGGGRSGVYVRRLGDDQAWLAAGEVKLPANPVDVMSRDVVDFPAERIARVRLGTEGAGPLTLSKPGPDAPDYVADAPVPEGRKLDPAKLAQVAGTLSNLTLQDVKPVAELSFPADAPSAVFTTWDGLDLQARLLTLGDGEKAERWVTLVPAEGTPVGAQPAPAEGAAPPAAKPVPEQVAELKARLDGWAFKLPEYTAARLGWRLTDLFEAEGSS